MKKLFTISLIFIALTISVSGQKIDFGIKLGLTAASLHGTYDGLSGNTGTIDNVDPRAFLNLNYGNLSIQPGLAFYLKGGGANAVNSSSFYFDSSTGISSIQASSSLLKIYYLEVPVNVLYHFPVKAGKLFIGAGPYLAMALSATSEVYAQNSGTSGSASQSTTKTSVSFGNGQNELNRFDFGINGLGGFRFNNGIELGIETGFGLANISNDSAVKAKNQTASLTVGYLF